MNFQGTKKLLQMVSLDLWARNWKIVIHEIWNPRACIQAFLLYFFWIDYFQND